MKLLWLLALMPMSAFATGPDYVYLYGDDSNTGYQCTAYHVYFDTEGFGSFYADRCQQVLEDDQQWPVFPQVGITISLDFAPRKAYLPMQPRIYKSCTFVAHAMAGNGGTSSVIDCRNQANATATAR